MEEGLFPDGIDPEAFPDGQQPLLNLTHIRYASCSLYDDRSKVMHERDMPSLLTAYLLSHLVFFP